MVTLEQFVAGKTPLQLKAAADQIELVADTQIAMLKAAANPAAIAAKGGAGKAGLGMVAGQQAGTAGGLLTGGAKTCGGLGLSGSGPTSFTPT